MFNKKTLAITATTTMTLVMAIYAGSVLMTGAPVAYAQDNQIGNETSAGAANATGTSAEQTANLTDGGATGDWEKNYKP